MPNEKVQKFWAEQALKIHFSKKWNKVFELGASYFVIEDHNGKIRQAVPGELIMLSVPMDSIKCRGWGATTPIPAKYVLTTERPPFHACAVRRYTDQVLDGAPFVAAARSFAVAHGHSLGPLQTRQRTIGPDIVSSAMMLQEVDEKGVPTLETYMFFVVSYPAMTKADGTEGKPFYDIRFVRQIYRQPV